MLVFVTIVVAESDAAVARPTVVVAGTQAVLVGPKAVVLGLFSEVGPPMVEVVEILFVIAVPIGFGVAAALVLEFEPK